jgi:hypothetical protein
VLFETVAVPSCETLADATSTVQEVDNVRDAVLVGVGVIVLVCVKPAETDIVTDSSVLDSVSDAVELPSTLREELTDSEVLAELVSIFVSDTVVDRDCENVPDGVGRRETVADSSKELDDVADSDGCGDRLWSVIEGDSVCVAEAVAVTDVLRLALDVSITLADPEYVAVRLSVRDRSETVEPDRESVGLLNVNESVAVVVAVPVFAYVSETDVDCVIV